HRQVGEYLLIFHLGRALDAHALHGEIEIRVVRRRNIVVIDAGTKVFPGAGPHRAQAQLRRARTQVQRGGARAIDHAHDESLAAAIVEELFDGIPQGTGLPEAAKHMLEFREARDEYRTIDRAAQRAADERGARSTQPRDVLIGAAFLFDLYPWIARREVTQRHQFF